MINCCHSRGNRGSSMLQPDHHLVSIRLPGGVTKRPRGCYHKQDVGADKLRSPQVKFLAKVTTRQIRVQGVSSPFGSCAAIKASFALRLWEPRSHIPVRDRRASLHSHVQREGTAVPPPGSLLLRTLHSHWKQFPEFTGRRRGTAGVEAKTLHTAGAFR